MSSSSSLPSPAILAVSRGACKSCYKYKEKCIFEHGNQACVKCCALGRVCLPRTKKRMGRRPGAGKFPHGNCSIIEFTPEASQKRGSYSMASPEPVPDTVEESISAGFVNNFAKRNLVVPGLEPSSRLEILALARSQQCSLNLYPLKSTLNLYPKFDQILATREGFFATHRQFMLGQGFADEFQVAIRLVFTRNPAVLMSAYSATLQLMGYRKIRPTGVEGLDVTLGAQCLEWLGNQASCIRDVEHAAVVLMVGQILLVYNTLLPCSLSRTITRGVLLSTKDWYPALLQRPNLDPIILSPLLVDTVDSLIRREMPIVRLPNLSRPIVDRLLGLCSPLLPLLFDLCERSYQVKTNTPIMLPGDLNSDPYHEIEYKIKSWTPEWPPDFFAKYHAIEIAIMLAQARSYRTASLLVIHRLRFPLGTQDRIGQGYAEDILNELSFMKQWPTDGATGLGLDFPLMVAMLEKPTSGEELFNAFNQLRYQSQVAKDILQLVGLIRKSYDSGYDGLWFDLVQDGMLDVLIP